MIKKLEYADVEVFAEATGAVETYRELWLKCLHYPSYAWQEDGKTLVMGGGVPVPYGGVALWSIHRAALPSLKVVRALKAGFQLVREAFPEARHFESYVRQGELGHMKLNKRLGFVERELVYGLEADGRASIRMVIYGNNSNK